MLKRKKPMKRGGFLKRGKARMKRTAFKARLGRVGKTRMAGNALAKARYFKTFGEKEDIDGKLRWVARCQCCWRKFFYLESHHKVQKGEGFQNKVCVCYWCHRTFIHDLTKPKRRKHVEKCEADVINGQRIDWGEHAEDLKAFARLGGQLQGRPKGPESDPSGAGGEG